MPRSSAIRFACVVGLSLCLVPVAIAHAQTSAARQEARERFDRGLRLFNQDNNEGALADDRRNEGHEQRDDSPPAVEAHAPAERQGRRSIGLPSRRLTGNS